MDLRTWTTLLAAIPSLALGVSVLLRGRTDRQHVLFVVFVLNLTAYYLATFFLIGSSRKRRATPPPSPCSSGCGGT